MTDTKIWDDITVNDKCYSHKGNYLGKCTEKYHEGPIHERYEVYKFQNGEKLSGSNLKFTEVTCDDAKLVEKPENSVVEKPENSVSENPQKEYFIVNVKYNSEGKKIYECPECKITTGTRVPNDPEKYASLFQHALNCSNEGKIPKEPSIGGKKYKKSLKRYSKKNAKSRTSKKFGKKRADKKLVTVLKRKH